MVQSKIGDRRWLHADPVLGSFTDCAQTLPALSNVITTSCTRTSAEYLSQLFCFVDCWLLRSPLARVCITCFTQRGREGSVAALGPEVPSAVGQCELRQPAVDNPCVCQYSCHQHMEWHVELIKANERIRLRDTAYHIKGSICLVIFNKAA